LQLNSKGWVGASNIGEMNMRVIGDNYKKDHEVNDDSIIFLAEEDLSLNENTFSEEWRRWRNFKKLISDDFLLQQTIEDLSEFGVAYIPGLIENKTATVRII
jgi:hypothetical protein